jgi:Mg2+/Co2+ transporter CorB
LPIQFSPHRIRWAAKRNQPVKSENEALQTAATIFVKFASQTGIIVSEEILREHFSVFGKVLDTTIRTITIDDVSIPRSCLVCIALFMLSTPP